MEHVIPVSVHRKIARNEGKLTYVCGNSDYVIEFSFDEDWDGLDVKTARFISNGTVADVVFTGNRCEMPVISNTYTIEVGVFSGNLKTTTPAVIMATKSILCGEGVPADPMPDVYAQVMELLNDSSTSAVAAAKDAAESAEDANEAARQAEENKDIAVSSAATATESALNAEQSAMAAAGSAENAEKLVETAETIIENKSWMYVEGRSDGHLYLITSDNLTDMTLRDNGSGRLVMVYGA